MKKIFKTLFCLLTAITLFTAINVNAEVKIDEDKKEMTYIVNKEYDEDTEDYTATYDIKDNILEISFPKPNEKAEITAFWLGNAIISSFNTSSNILTYGNYEDFDLTKDGASLETTGEEDQKIPKLIKINLSHNGRNKETTWEALKKELVKVSELAGDTFGGEERSFNVEFQRINYEGNLLSYEIRDGIITIKPQSDNKLTLDAVEYFIMSYIMELELDYNTVDIYNTKLEESGIEVEKLDEENCKSLKLNLAKTGKSPEKVWQGLIERIEYIPDNSDEPSKEEKSNTKPSGTKVNVKNTAVTYSIIAITCGVICILIGAGLIFVLNTNKKKK